MNGGAVPGRRALPVALRGALPLIALFLLLLSGSEAARAEPTATLEVRVQPSEILLGQQAEAELRVRIDGTGASSPVASQGSSRSQGQLPRFPAWEEQWGGMEILEVGPVHFGGAGSSSDGAKGPAAVVYRQRVTLTAFRPGVYELPPVEVEIPDLAGEARGAGPRELLRSEGLTVTVRGTLPESVAETAEPRPPAPPRPLPAPAASPWQALRVVGGAIAIALLGLAALLVFRRLAVRPGETPAPDRTPWEELLRSLEALRGQLAPGREPDPLTFHLELSRALRLYLSRRLSLPAAESTTPELAVHLPRALGAIPTLTIPERKEIAEGLLGLLRACDRGKFAGERAGVEALRDRLGAAEELARRLEARWNDSSPGEASR